MDPQYWRHYPFQWASFNDTRFWSKNNNLPQELLQGLQLIAQVIVHVLRDAPTIDKPLELALESLIAHQERHNISEEGSAFPEEEKSSVKCSVLSINEGEMV